MGQSRVVDYDRAALAQRRIKTMTRIANSGDPKAPDQTHLGPVSDMTNVHQIQIVLPFDQRSAGYTPGSGFLVRIWS